MNLFRENIFSLRKIRPKGMYNRNLKSGCWVIISAAGLGSRMNSKAPKQYLHLKKETILKRCVYNFLQLQRIKKIIIVTDNEDYYWKKCNVLHKRVAIAKGGRTRADSISNGLKYLKSTAHDRDWVLIHDAVRPCIDKLFVNNLLLLTLREEVGGLPVIPVFDTIKNVNKKSVLGTVQRAGLYISQTPQVFRYGVIVRSIESVVRSSIEITDESNALELVGEEPKFVIGDRRNIKITSCEDIEYVNKIFS